MGIVLLYSGGALAQDSLAVNAEKNSWQPEPLKIVLSPIEKSARNHVIYFPKLLELALTKTEATDGPFVITYHPQLYTSARVIAELMSGRSINVIWTLPSDAQKKELLAVPVSLLRDLNSHRAFLIRKEDQHKFTAIQSLNDLRRLRAGAVINWPDTKIMQHNDLPVVTTPHYELLFTMLAGKRFDYFPRGLYEIWEEQKFHSEKDLVIEQTIMLRYTSPINFYVNKKDKKLADRIERGLNIAIEDGSFDKLFLSVPGFKKGMNEIHSGKRKIFDLEREYFDEDPEQIKIDGLIINQ